MNNVTNETKVISTEEKKGRLPDFIIIGAAKSGTTTLYQYLCRHPQIFMSKIKEPEFFSDDSVYNRGVDWYESLFARAEEMQICGEASTRYTRWPHTSDSSKRIFDVLSSGKFIYIMRHPVERAFSHYVHEMREGITMTFEEALKNTDIVDTSMYMAQLERFLRFFPRERFFFVLFDDLIREPADTLRRIQRFLGIDEIHLTNEGPALSNPGRVDFYIRQRTTHLFRALPGSSRLIDHLPKSWRNYVNRQIKRSLLGIWLKKRYNNQFALLPATRDRLLRIFQEPNRKLSEFLGQDLSHWSC